MKPHVNIILANAPVKNGNRGCVALTISALGLIDSIMKKRGIAYDIYLPDSGYKDCDEKEYVAQGTVYRYHVCDYYRHVDLKTTLKKKVRSALSRISFKKPFVKADFILDVGQGDSFADIYGKYRFDSIDLIHSIARELHKPYCILPQTIGPFLDKSNIQRANYSVSKASLCLVRDQQSYEYVKKNIPSQQNLHECIDLAFFLPFEKINFDEDFIHVGLNVSALLWNGGYTRDNQFGLKCNYKDVIRNILKFFLEQPKVKVHLISHVVSAERCVENDYEVCYELWREYKAPNLVIAPFALGPIEIKSYISGMDFFMGARMHATIASFSSGVPVVPMAYSRKFNGLFVDTLAYPHMVDMKVQDDDEILSTIKEAFENRLTLKSDIANRLNGVVKDRCNLLIREIENFFNVT